MKTFWSRRLKCVRHRGGCHLKQKRDVPSAIAGQSIFHLRSIICQRPSRPNLMQASLTLTSSKWRGNTPSGFTGIGPTASGRYHQQQQHDPIYCFSPVSLEQYVRRSATEAKLSERPHFQKIVPNHYTDLLDKEATASSATRESERVNR